MKFTIDGCPPSANELLRMHWAVKKRMRQRLAWQIAAAIGIGKWPVEKARKRLMIEIWRAPKPGKKLTRRLDPDNLVGGCKILIDALRDMGLLYQDSPRWLELDEPIQHLTKENPRTTIEIVPSKNP